jgi:hypothetical protein
METTRPAYTVQVTRSGGMVSTASACRMGRSGKLIHLGVHGERHPLCGLVNGRTPRTSIQAFACAPIAGITCEDCAAIAAR